VARQFDAAIVEAGPRGEPKHQLLNVEMAGVRGLLERVARELGLERSSQGGGNGEPVRPRHRHATSSLDLRNLAA
jgi:hypothetical protein